MQAEVVSLSQLQVLKNGIKQQLAMIRLLQRQRIKKKQVKDFGLISSSQRKMIVKSTHFTLTSLNHILTALVKGHRRKNVAL